MIKVSPEVSVSLGKLEDYISGNLKSLWLYRYVDGQLPSMVLEIENSDLSENVVFSSPFECKIFTGADYVIAESPFIIISKNRSQDSLTLTCNLVSTYDMIYGTKSATYDTIDEAINTLWRGNIEYGIPDFGVMKLSQMNENNNVYLTKLLRSLYHDSTFCLDWKNNLVRVVLEPDPEVVSDLTDGKIYSIVDDIQTLDYNVTTGYEVNISNSGKYSTVTFGINHYVLDKEIANLESNYFSSVAKIMRNSDMLDIEYQDPAMIEMGKTYKLNVVGGAGVFTPLGTKIVIEGNSIQCSSKILRLG